MFHVMNICVKGRILTKRISAAVPVNSNCTAALGLQTIPLPNWLFATFCKNSYSTLEVI